MAPVGRPDGAPLPNYSKPQSFLSSLGFLGCQSAILRLGINNLGLVCRVYRIGVEISLGFSA